MIDLIDLIGAFNALDDAGFDCINKLLEGEDLSQQSTETLDKLHDYLSHLGYIFDGEVNPQYIMGQARGAAAAILSHLEDRKNTPALIQDV